MRRRPLILVVDDVADVREAVARALGDAGFLVETAKDGVEGVRKTVELAPDLVVMDLGLPKIDGVEATRLLKRLEGTRHIPIVAFTGQIGVDRDGGARRWFDEVVAKEGDLAELVRRVSLLVSGQGAPGSDPSTDSSSR
ncbi:MAG TPA: response regulator [Vicinamibacterales bacterium]|nr:response regulator [Vicinamibacterales bacterium]